MARPEPEREVVLGHRAPPRDRSFGGLCDRPTIATMDLSDCGAAAGSGVFFTPGVPMLFPFPSPNRGWGRADPRIIDKRC